MFQNPNDLEDQDSDQEGEDLGALGMSIKDSDSPDDLVEEDEVVPVKLDEDPVDGDEPALDLGEDEDE